jgi:tRNA/rRNA methyltransferase
VELLGHRVILGSDHRALPSGKIERMINDDTTEGRFVLVHTSHRGNIGAAARAMKVMGFRDLVLVAPRFDDALEHPDALAMASGAVDVLEGARVVATLTDALHGITHACATAMTPRDFGPAVHAPRAFLPTLANDGQRVAFVFGSERLGLSNDDVYACHSCLSIPTDARYGSLNLAQAVQIVAYEWRQAIGGFEVVARVASTPRADAVAVDGLLGHWQRTLVDIGFLDPAAPKRLLPRLRRLMHRAQLTDEEVHILRGIARAVAQPRPRR